MGPLISDDVIKAIANDITDNIGENNGLADPNASVLDQHFDKDNPYRERPEITYEDIPIQGPPLPPDIRIARPIFKKIVDVPPPPPPMISDSSQAPSIPRMPRAIPRGMTLQEAIRPSPVQASPAPQTRSIGMSARKLVM